MTVTVRHPEYEGQLLNWEQMTDTRQGEQVVKAAGVKYLPPTSGMQQDGMSEGEPGELAYEAYKLRAVWPTDVKDGIEAMVGLLHRKPPTITLPKAMEPMLERMTIDGADSDTLLRRINALQLEHGRLGLLVEFPDDAPAGTLPFIAVYGAISIVNWNTTYRTDGVEELAIVVLDETGMQMQPNLSWKQVFRHRILTTDFHLQELAAGDAILDKSADPHYVVGVSDTVDTSLAAIDFVEPKSGGKTFSSVPFVFINTQDLSFAPDVPPLLGLSNTCLAIYRGEADYRQSLFMQSQDTLVITGAEAGLDPESEKSDRRVGAGAVMELPQGATAAYIGVQSTGLTEQREALAALQARAAQQASRLLDTVDGSSRQSGDALRIRVAARTASLVSIQRAGAAGLEAALKMVARWMGFNEDEVSVTADPDFADSGLTGKDLLDWVNAKNQGAPISWETIHNMLQDSEVTEMTFEEEQAAIEEEAPVGGVDPVTGQPLGQDVPIDPKTGLPIDQNVPQGG